MRLLILLILALTTTCCVSKKKTNSNSQANMTEELTPQFTPGPPVLVYKTVFDYNNLVPVMLSEDKTTIVSYPHPADLLSGSRYPMPTLLNNGYLLDNRGIGKNVAFLKLTYEEYAKLKEAPALKELYDLIIDKDPLLELCDCGNKKAFTDLQKQLNKLIDNNTLRTKCKRIK